MISDLESHRQPKKRRKLDDQNRNDATQQLNRKWKTPKEQQIYSQKLIDAIRRTRRGSKASGGRQIRETADRVLAASAKGTTRWSRAILARRIGRLRLTKRRRARKSGDGRLKKKAELVGEKRRLPAAERKVKFLSRLIPGCRKVSLSNILEEATDYISALEMQVRAMTALAQILAATSSTNSAPSRAEPSHDSCV